MIYRLSLSLLLENKKIKQVFPVVISLLFLPAAPVKGALPPLVGQADYEDGQEDGHDRQPVQPQLPEMNGPGVQENYFYIEQDEYDGYMKTASFGSFAHCFLH